MVTDHSADMYGDDVTAIAITVVIMAMMMVGDEKDFIWGLILGSMTATSFCRRSKSSQAVVALHPLVIIQMQLFYMNIDFAGAICPEV